MVSDRSRLTLSQIIDKIQNDMDSSVQGIAVTIKTICERYLSNTAVSNICYLFYSPPRLVWT